MIKTKKQMYLVISVFTLILLLGTTTYAFFNYTRTGVANRISVGRISFVSRQTNTINLTNLFPIDPTETGIMNDSTKVGTLEIEIEGDTDYSEGVEYVLYAVNSNNTVNGKTVPISLDFNVDNLGTESSNYWMARESKNATIYKKIVGNTLEGNEMLFVGYIKPNTTSGTAEGVDGSITIKAYLDINNIAITDTPDENIEWQDGRVVISTTEWNSLRASGVSFKVKVEANEGIWVEKPNALNTIKKNVIVPSNPIDFGEISSSSNGEGLYVLPGTENDTNPIYYYRGAVNDNNVVFGDYCWQIVRTTDTGGIKMIYNGEPTITGSGNNITYDCGTTRPVGHIGGIKTTTGLSIKNGYFYADGYEIVSGSGNSIRYRLKQGTNPVTRVEVRSNNASTAIQDIVANYPYTCKETAAYNECTNLYKVDSQSSGTTANIYTATSRSLIGNSAYNLPLNSMSSIGYMNNESYSTGSSGWNTDALFASSATWVTDHYELTDASVTTPDATHHYSCNATTSEATCTDLRYVYYLSGTTKYYITLSNGILIEDALFRMTGNGNSQTKQNNSSYILNQNSSPVKTKIDEWFRMNLTNDMDNTKINYQLYLEDTVFCNDRSGKVETGSIATYSESGWNSSGSIKKFLYFGTFNRYHNSYYSTVNIPSVTCPNEIDRFTVSSSNGNGALTYPVGLLTADEAIMAGIGGNGNNTNNSYYLYIGDYAWTMSPYNFNNVDAHGFYINKLGIFEFSDGVNYPRGVRPVVSLKLGTEFESGGDGTPTNPYVVKYE